jgi:primosomal protein N'
VSSLPAIGSRVRVPWGRGNVEGEVVETYDSGFGAQVVVAVILEGSDQPLTATFRAGAVELAA